MIRMIVTDLDGTLLRKDKTISAYTASVLQRCIDRGIKFVIATARPIRAVKMIGLPVDCAAFVYHNGAVIDTGSEQLHFGIAPQATSVIVAAILQNDAQARVWVEIDDAIYGNTEAGDVWPGIAVNITDFSDLPQRPADKIILHGIDPNQLEAVRASLPDDLYLEVSENTVSLIMHKDATKRNAVIQLCSAFGISANEVAAFGDDHNDIGMLSYCSCGVAVQNAINEAKAAAPFICDANEQDGVAKWIDEHILSA